METLQKYLFFILLLATDPVRSWSLTKTSLNNFLYLGYLDIMDYIHTIWTLEFGT